MLVRGDDWTDCLVPAVEPPAELVAQFRRKRGSVPDWVARLAPTPWLVHALDELTSAPVAHLPPRLWELVALIVSRDNSCHYCYGTQRAFMKMLGYREQDLDRIERDLHDGGLSAGDVMALEYARKVSHCNPRPTAADLAALEGQGFSRPQIAELTLAAASTVFANRVSTLVALPQESFVAQLEKPWVRLLRPVLALWMTPRLRAPVRAPSPDDGLYAPVVAALDGSPGSVGLRGVVDAALASSVLPRRTKLLMLAVVAETVDCALGRAQARAGLAAEDFPAAALDDVLAHLGSPVLDAREARLVPFARESVRYGRNLDVQTRLREVTAGAPAAELLEVVGMLALANMVCRLSVLVDRC